jgi:hypothetical protein
MCRRTTALCALQAPDKPESETPPLVEVQMLLESKKICWKPALSGSQDGGGSVQHMFQQWSKRYLATGDLMKRLDVGEGTYGREIEEDYDVMFAYLMSRQLCCAVQHLVAMLKHWAASPKSHEPKELACCCRMPSCRMGHGVPRLRQSSPYTRICGTGT